MHPPLAPDVPPPTAAPLTPAAAPAPGEPPPTPADSRGVVWKWWVCGLLLLATTINYMDRLTLNQTAGDIMNEFGFGDVGYGELESAFAIAFAIGSIGFGWLVDRSPIRWVFPLAVIAWSAAGFSAGLVQGFMALMISRFLLGIAEACNWPCSLRTTQHILPPAERSLGNGLLQSGTAVGSVLTPLLVIPFLGQPGGWRIPFMLVGGTGMLWAGLWLVSVRKGDLEVRRSPDPSNPLSLLAWILVLFGVDACLRYGVRVESREVLLASRVLTGILGMIGVLVWLIRATAAECETDRATFLRRLVVLTVAVITVNATWHYFRVWLPRFLAAHEFDARAANYFMMGYYAATAVGSLASGFLAMWLAGRGLSVHTSRLVVFAGCAAVTTLSGLAAVVPPGPWLLVLFLVIGTASLGLFPLYYSFSQELSVRHQGKITGTLGCLCWLAMSIIHEATGESVERTKSFTESMTVAGLLPLLGVLAVYLCWDGIPFARRPVPPGA